MFSVSVLPVTRVSRLVMTSVTSPVPSPSVMFPLEVTKGFPRPSTVVEDVPEDALFVSSLLDMRTPGGRGKDKKDGANQTMGMYSKDSAFSRVLKLQEALYKVQGRIAKIADSLRALEESDRRMALEKQRLEILRMRATGAVDVPDPDGTAADDLDAPLEEDTEE
mgnify:CR=1 FL=1